MSVCGLIEATPLKMALENNLQTVKRIKPADILPAVLGLKRKTAPENNYD